MAGTRRVVISSAGRRLPQRDVLIVGYWTDWDYLNRVLLSCLGNALPRAVVIVDPSSSEALEVKAPDLWAWAARPKSIESTSECQVTNSSMSNAIQRDAASRDCGNRPGRVRGGGGKGRHPNRLYSTNITPLTCTRCGEIGPARRPTWSREVVRRLCITNNLGPSCFDSLPQGPRWKVPISRFALPVCGSSMLQAVCSTR